MNNNHFARTFKYFIYLLVLLLLLPSGALAAKPDFYSDEFTFETEVVDCGEFSVMDEVTEIDKIKDFYDKNGSFIRSQINITASDNMFRADDPDGVHLYGTAHISAWITFDQNGDALWTQNGKAVAIIVPQYGPIFLDAGKLIFNMDNGWELLFSAGRNKDWNFGDFAALCEFFEQD